MGNGDLHKIRDVFCRARDVAPGDRDAFLEAACGGDTSVRREVDELLAADAGGDANSPLVTFAVASPAAAAISPHLDGYTLHERLGEGGMGVVWRATQHSTKRDVALKVMGAAFLGSERARQRFDREVELTARLDHPNIARVFDSDVRQGLCFYAMQLVDGVPLGEYVKARQLDRTEVLRLMLLVCRAVQHAHQHGVIHRDLKPSNILVDANGQPHVLDFGLAKALDDAAADAQLSRDGDVVGTPSFMSPEQAAGDVARIDTRTDVYALGVILFHVLSEGQYPHDPTGSASDVMRRISERDARPLPSPDRDLQAIVAKALERSPDRRYASAGELADDLGRYLAHEPLVARPPTLTYLLRKRVRRYRVPLTLATGVSLLLLGTAVYAYVQIKRERDVAVAAEAEKERQRAAAERHREDAERQRAVAVQTLRELTDTAPTFFDRAQSLLQAQDLENALKNATYAATLVPAEPSYVRLRADLLQSLLRFDDAGQAYARLLALHPDDPHAKVNVALSDRLAAAHAGGGGGVTAALRKDWEDTLRAQQRNVEALVVAQRLEAPDRARAESVNRYRPLLQRAGFNPASLYVEKGRLKLDLTKEPKPINWEAVRGLPLEWLDAPSCGLTDCGVLAGMRLQRLDLPRNPVANIQALRGMPLIHLDLDGTQVNDLSPLAGAPLGHLSIRNTRVHDFSPLRGAPLRVLSANTLPVSDLAPLHGMPLEELSVPECRNIRDLSPLRGAPLKSLNALDCPVDSVEPLRGMPLTYLLLRNSRVSDIAPLRGIPIRTLNLAGTPVADLQPLRDMPLDHLHIGTTGGAPIDLTPLVGKPLRRLSYQGEGCLDGSNFAALTIEELSLTWCGTRLEGLRGQPLQSLTLNYSEITDISFIEGMPLRALDVQSCKKLRDLRPLSSCPDLETLALSAHCTDVDYLRAHPRLSTFVVYEDVGPYNTMTREQFWRMQDERKRRAASWPAR